MDRKSCARFQALVMGLALIMLSACSTVTPEQLSAVQSQASSAASTAGKAASDAASALGAAKEAKLTADAAKAAADAAQSTADAAVACCNENKDRIERMFEQTMKK